MDSKFWDLAAKELSGNATPAELEELSDWRAADSKNESQYITLQKLWQTTAPADAVEVNTDAAWQQVRSRLTVKEDARVIPLYAKLMRVAAAVILLIGISWLVQYLFFPYMGMQVVESGSRSMSLVLPDSSLVWLNKESKLAYDSDFDGEVREVKLEGEAFFEVKHNPKRPFVIQTKRTKARVLGTSFNLRDYISETTAELSVATGKVAFAPINGNFEKEISAGSIAVQNTQANGVMIIKPLEGQNAWAWKSGKLTFRTQPLQQVVKDLERYYGVNIKLQNTGLGSCRFTGSFQDAQLAEVLEVLETTLRLHYQTQDKETYTFTGTGCQK